MQNFKDIAVGDTVILAHQIGWGGKTTKAVETVSKVTPTQFTVQYGSSAVRFQKKSGRCIGSYRYSVELIGKVTDAERVMTDDTITITFTRQEAEAAEHELKKTIKQAAESARIRFTSALQNPRCEGYHKCPSPDGGLTCMQSGGCLGWPRS